MDHVACVFTNAIKLDDGKMEPQALAKLVQPICHEKHVAAEAAVGVSAEQAQNVEYDHTLAAVMLYRSRVRSSP